MLHFFSRKKSSKTIVFLQAHELGEETLRLFEALKSSKSRLFDVKIILNDEGGSPLILSDSLNESEIIRFRVSDLKSLGVPLLGDSIVPGGHHLPMLYASRLVSSYDYYWLMEYDVRFSGQWAMFFEYFENNTADLIGTHFAYYDSCPQWVWWKSMSTKFEVVNKEHWVRGFLPIMRLSRRAVKKTLIHQQKRWNGHPEAILPTLINYFGMTIMDIGGDGEFTHPDFRNLFYTSNASNQYGQILKGSFRYRPVHKKWGSQPNKLYHPVKFDSN